MGFHPLVFRWTAGVWMTILLTFSYAMMIPNNIIATTIDKVQRESQYQQQMNLTEENLPKIQGMEPFFISYGEYGEVISLYSIDFVPYLELKDESNNHAVITFEKVNQYVKDEEHQVVFSKNISNSTTLDRIFLVKQENHDGILLYTDKFGTEMLFRVVGQEDFYHIENKTISLEPTTYTDKRFGNKAFYLSTLNMNLKAAIPVNPLDPETVTYAHIPYYTLKPTNDFPFPWLQFSIENRPLLPYYPYYTIGEKSADKDGNNYLSTTKPVDDSEVMYASLYNTSDRAFINHGADCYYFYLTALVDEQVRVSNAVMMTKEQYLRGSW